MADFEVLVSIQARGSEHDPRAGHVAAAVLGESGTVLVPAPPPALLDPAREFQVVTIPVPLRVEQPVERLPIWCNDVLSAGGRPVVAVLKLTQRSRYPATVRPFRGPELATTLQSTGGNLWTAMERLGLVRPGLAAGPPAEVLAGLPAIEREQRRANLRTHPHAAPADVALSICKILCICQPGPA